MMSSNGYQVDSSSEWIITPESSSEFDMSSSSVEYVNPIPESSSASSSDIISPERPTLAKLQTLFGRKALASFMYAAGSQSSSSVEDSTESSSVFNSESSSEQQHGGHHHNWYQSSESSESSESSDSFEVYADESLTGVIFLSVVVMIIGFFLAYLKVYSLVLAWKLRKMIIAEALAPQQPAKDPQVHEFAPSNTSCAVDVEAPTTPAAPVAPFQPINMGAPMFAPGFAPYPYMMVPPQQQGQQMPMQYPHMMFGQQPVFYTYAPSMEQPNEKL